MSEKKTSCGHDNANAYVIVLAGEENSYKICQPCHERAQREAYKPKVLRRERIPLEVGSQTLVGTITMLTPTGPCMTCGHDHKESPYYRGTENTGLICCYCEEAGREGKIPMVDPFPLGGGNCCGIINMNAENVREALKRWPELAVDCEVEIIDLGRDREHVRVVDDRLPDAWKKHRCSSCGYFEDDSPPPELPGPDDPPPETGYVFSPYVPVVKSAMVNGQEVPIKDGRPDLSGIEVPRKLRTKWSLGTAKDMVNPDFFGKIDVENLD